VIALIKAVRHDLMGDGVIAGLCTGGIHTGRAPDTATMPYLILSRLSGFRPEYYTSDHQVEQVTMRFQTWSHVAETVLNATERVEKLFRTTWPSLDDGTVIYVSKESDGLELDPDPDDSGNDVWQGIIDMTFLVQRDPTA